MQNPKKCVCLLIFAVAVEGLLTISERTVELSYKQVSVKRARQRERACPQLRRPAPRISHPRTASHARISPLCPCRQLVYLARPPFPATRTIGGCPSCTSRRHAVRQRA